MAADAVSSDCRLAAAADTASPRRTPPPPLDEIPIVLKRYGFCVDGCALHFLPSADLVISPYHCHRAEVTPRHEYPRAMVFSLLHADDILTLFEEGYRDTVQWLESGGTSRDAERRAHAEGVPCASMRSLVDEASKVFLSIAGIGEK
jgi:hypothetical protein